MDYVLFIYSVILTLLFGACGFGFFVTHRRSGSGRDYWVAVMFFFFTVDNLIFSMTEFIHSFEEIAAQFMLPLAFLNHLLAIGMLYSYRMILGYEFDDLPSKHEKIFHLVFLAMLLFFTAFSEQVWGRISYHILDQLIVAVIIFRGYLVLDRRKTGLKKRYYKAWVVIFILGFVTHLVGAIERGASILGFSFTSISRVIGFELFGILCTYVAIWYLLKRLSVPPPAARFSDDELMQLFISHYKLTPREAELIPLLLSGVRNSEICKDKYISLNTVKAHTHNIYRKLGIERRSQLAVKYSEFSTSCGVK